MGCLVLTPRCFAYRHAATTFYQLQRGFGGRRQHARIQDFSSVLFSPQLILHFTEGGQMVLLLRKLYFTLPRIQKSPLFSWGGGGFQLLPGGPNVTFYRNPYMYLLFSRGGGVRTPYPLLDPHMGNFIITGQYLSQSGL